MNKSKKAAPAVLDAADATETKTLEQRLNECQTLNEQIKIICAELEEIKNNFQNKN